MNMDKITIVNDNGDGIYEVICDNSQIRYYVNEKKKTVAAVMYNCRKQAHKEVCEIFGRLKFWRCINVVIKDTYRGKSHCIGTDKFDLETGMRIAREHMLAKYYRDYFNALDKDAEILCRVHEAIHEKLGTLYCRAHTFTNRSLENQKKANLYKENSENLT